uniref:ubiquitinyl hydrolase 1 n=1 Tax=Lotharella globosa TaxID=91324 RepID=A0A6V3KVY6_9EUKA
MAYRGGCKHVPMLSKADFRKMIRRKFLGEVNGSIPSSAQVCPEVTKESSASVIASAGAPYTGKDELIRTQTIIHCEACASEGGGHSEEAKERVRKLVEDSRIGSICNLDLWLCMHCGFMGCLNSSKQHVFGHFKKTGHAVWIQCHDSHVFCIPCLKYVYPRELSGSNRYEQLLDNIVYQWLLTLGRVRIWWRCLEKNEPPGDSKEIVRGVENFGNTCFFTSTCQALTHCKPFCDKITKTYTNDRPIEAELRNLINLYWSKGVSPKHINPRRFFTAVQQNALFGQYGDHTMEDANSLVVDILNGVDPQMANSTFGVRLGSMITCKGTDCIQAQRQSMNAELVTNQWPTRAAEAILDFTFGPAPSLRALPMETVLSLGIAEIANEQQTETKNNNNNNTSTGDIMQGGTRQERAVFQAMTIHVPKDEKPVALEALIKRYFAEEPIPDYKCGKCNKKGACFKTVRPRSLPPVLILQLKRFAPIAMGVQIKCHRKVEVPEMLDMKGFLPDDYKDEAKYKLSSMVQSLLNPPYLDHPLLSNIDPYLSPTTSLYSIQVNEIQFTRGGFM